jgi:hypothetical protein
MEHPLINNLDHLSEEELGAKISELSKKLGIAMQTGNGHLCSQIRLAINTYQNKYSEKLSAGYKKQLDDAKIDTSKINIQ